MKTDPRVKLLIILLLSTLAVLAKDVAYLGIIVVFALIADLCFKVDILTAISRLKHFLWLLLFITVVQSLCIKGGTVLIHIGSVNLLTTRGLQFALEFILRMSIIMFAGAIAMSTIGHEMLDGMRKLHLPYDLIFMSSIALRFLPLFREEFRARLNAIAMRGINLKKIGLSKKIKVYSYLISPTISGSILKSEELARAMQARGFRAYKHRTMLRQLSMSFPDWCITLLCIALAAGFLACMYIFGVIAVF